MSRQWAWMKSAKPPKCKLTPWQKQAILAETEKFVESFYRARFIEPPPASHQLNYIVEFSTSWHGPYLRFVAKFACPGPNAISPFFERAFARLGYFGPDRYNLWTHRHNDEWLVIQDGLTLQECFSEMRENPWFHF